MNHITETEISAIVKFKFNAFKADEKVFRKHLAKEFEEAGAWFGDFDVVTDYIDFEKYIVGVEYDFGDSYNDKYSNTIWDCIEKQLKAF